MNVPGLEICPRCHGDHWQLELDVPNLCISMVCRDCNGSLYFDVSSKEVEDQ